MLAEEVDARHDIELLTDEPVARQHPAMLRIVVLDVFNKPVVHRLDAADQSLADNVDRVVRISQRQVQLGGRADVECRRRDDIDAFVLDVERVRVERDGTRRQVGIVAGLRRHRNVARTVDTIINLDLVDVRGQRDVIADIGREAGADIERRFLGQCRAARRDDIRVADREQALFDLQAGRAVEGRDDRRDVRLPRRRCMEPCRHGTAQRECIIDAETGRDLAVQRAAEVREVLVARGVLQQQLIRDVVLDVGVDRDVVTLEVAGVLRLDAAETAGAGSEEGVRLAGEGGEGLFASFETECQVDCITDRHREVGAGRDFFLGITADIKVHLRQAREVAWSQRRVGRVIEEVVELVLAVAVAEVVQHAVVELAVDADDEARIVLRAVEERREAARQPRPALLDEAQGVRYQVERIRSGIRIADRATVAERALARKCRVRRAAIEEAIAPVGLGEAEARVQLRRIADLEARVQEEPHAFRLRTTPGLDKRCITEDRILSDRRIAAVDQRLGVRPLDAARQPVVVDVFDRRIDEAGVTERQPDVGAGMQALLAVEKFAVLQLCTAALGCVFQYEVDDAGDRVGAVLR